MFKVDHHRLPRSEIKLHSILHNFAETINVIFSLELYGWRNSGNTSNPSAFDRRPQWNAIIVKLSARGGNKRIFKCSATYFCIEQYSTMCLFSGRFEFILSWSQHPVNSRVVSWCLLRNQCPTVRDPTEISTPPWTSLAPIVSVYFSCFWTITLKSGAVKIVNSLHESWLLYILSNGQDKNALLDTFDPGDEPRRLPNHASSLLHHQIHNRLGTSLLVGLITPPWEGMTTFAVVLFRLHKIKCDRKS